MTEIPKVSAETLLAIKKKSAFALPDHPTAAGFTAADLRKAFWQPVADNTDSALSELDRVVTAVNTALGAVDNTADADKPVSAAQQAALNARVPLTRKVNGKALSGDITLSPSDIGLGQVDNTADADKPLSAAATAALALKLNAAEKGAASGVAELDGNGKVPAAQLPSFVDDVLEYASTAAFPAAGESGKIYVSLADLRTYRWSGSGYAEISASLALGETAATACRGDRGSAAYAHSLLTSGNPHAVTKADVGLGQADNTADADKPVSAAQQAALDAKTNPDGYYSQMGVGTADNLAGKGDAVSCQFLFRTTCGEQDVRDGTATVKAIKGRTLCWNQLSPNGNFASGTTGWTALLNCTLSVAGGTLSAAYSGSGDTFRFFENVSAPAGHKVLVYYKLRTEGTGISRIQVFFGGSAGNVFITNYAADGDYCVPATLSTSTNTLDFCVTVSGADTGTRVSVRDVMVFDLTAMFGAGAEPTAESFSKFFPQAYYPFEPGALRSFAATAVRTVGFNQFDGQHARVLAGQKYVIEGAHTTLGFRTAADGTDSAVTAVAENGYDTFTPTYNGYLTVTGADGTTCVHLSWSGIRNGDFEAYSQSGCALPVATWFPAGMRSAGGVHDELRRDRAITRCGIRAYHAGDENDAAVITDKTNTVYALSQPTEQIFATPLNLCYPVSDFGTEEIVSALPVPCRMETVYGFNATDTLRRLPVNYIGKESMAAFITALSAALSLTVTAAYNETEGRYGYTVVSNADPA